MYQSSTEELKGLPKPTVPCTYLGRYVSARGARVMMSDESLIR
jgi:hypothetical protein